LFFDNDTGPLNGYVVFYIKYTGNYVKLQHYMICRIYICVIFSFYFEILPKSIDKK